MKSLRLMKHTRRLSALLLAAALAASAQVSYERILHAEREPENWLTYSGNYSAHRYSPLDQINRENVANLEMKWAYQMRSLGKVETTPIVVDGIMYATQPPNDVIALDVTTGQPYWTYRRPAPDDTRVCCGRINRGVAILGDRLYLGTVDAHLVALDARSGNVIWDVEVANYRDGYAVTAAPLVVKDKIIVGIAGGELGIRGFLDAYDAKTGERVWRFKTIPEPGEPGNETWLGDSWKTGGAPTWVTGSFDPELNLIYWGTGNPAPDWNADIRLGDNLYSDSVVALDADTGELKWYYQFTPNDPYDWDACQVPVLVDAEYAGQPRKLMVFANRNAFYYVLDRVTGEYLTAQPFSKQTWAAGIDEDGRPIFRPEMRPKPEGTLVYPGVLGASNWFSPAYSPRTKMLYVSAWEYATIYQPFPGDLPHEPGEFYYGGLPREPRNDPGTASVKALDVSTGDLKWEFPQHSRATAGTFATAGDLVFFGNNEGHFLAFDAENGKLLWRANTGGRVAASAVSYLSKGKQYITLPSGNALFTFGLRD
jgi:alcohol dehydrogenase (cytochrome c)